MNQWKNYLKIKQAADFLGVSELTLRNWDKKEKLSPHRHPINGYRLYRISDLELFMERIGKNRPKKLKVKFEE